MSESTKSKLLLFGIVIVLITICANCTSVKHSTVKSNVDACPNWVACKPLKF